MDYRSLGIAGVRVSPICLGTAFRGQEDDDVCIRTIERAIDLGCNFIDTANYYGRGRSERILARALKGKRDDIVLASKVCSPMGDGPNDRGLSRFAIMREIERSLRRLETDHLDLYILHQFDPHTRLEETMRTMDDLVRQGKVRYVGVSNFGAARLSETLWVCDRGDYEPPVCLQIRYNLLGRYDIEPEVMPLCRRHGVGITTFSPLAIGLLTGRFRRGQPAPTDTPWGKNKYKLENSLTEQNDRIIGKLIDIAEKLDKTPAQVAIAWILDHPEVAAAIIGPDTPEHVDENMGAAGWALEPEDRAALDEVSEVEGPQRYVE